MQERVNTLFDLYYKGEASFGEIQELKALIRKSENDHALKKALKRAWNHLDPSASFPEFSKSEEIFQSIVGEEADQTDLLEELQGIRKISSWLWYAAAIVLIGIGVLWQNYDTRKAKVVTAVSQGAKPLATQPEESVLILGERAPIYIGKSPIGDIAVEGQSLIRKTNHQELTYQLQGSVAGENTGEKNQLFTGRGEQFKLVLSDGSKIWLNAFSSIEFPSSFNKNERRVKISGEAYFEIAKDKHKPFIVQYNDSELKVLGTRFNIMAYSNEGKSKTTLVEGAIALRVKNKELLLHPNQQAIIDTNGSFKVTTVDAADEIAWQNGWIRFKNASVQEVMRQIARWHAVDIVYDAAIAEKQYTGMVPVHAKIDEILEMLQYAGIDCKMEKNQIRVH